MQQQSQTDQNTVADLWLKIDQLHLNFIKAEESTRKIDIRKRLEGKPESPNCSNEPYTAPYTMYNSYKPGLATNSIFFCSLSVKKSLICLQGKSMIFLQKGNWKKLS